jgi:hypothetical protein
MAWKKAEYEVLKQIKITETMVVEITMNKTAGSIGGSIMLARPEWNAKDRKSELKWIRLDKWLSLEEIKGLYAVGDSMLDAIDEGQRKLEEHKATMPAKSTPTQARVSQAAANIEVQQKILGGLEAIGSTLNQNTQVLANVASVLAKLAGN